MATENSSSDSPLSNKFYIPSYVLLPDSKVQTVAQIPVCPVLVFINSKSGGQLGGNLLVTYRALLNEHQVFDLGLESPDKVLSRIYMNLERLKLEGNEPAAKIQETLKIIVAGGDGTAGWLLGVVSDLKLPHPPAIATVPLGTGNNLPFAFGWGKKNPGTDRRSVEAFLEQVMEAEEMKIDSWHILMRMRAPHDGSFDPIPPLELPHSLHAFGRVSSSDELNMEGHHTFRGGFWNYFSLGMDAQVSYAFHAERKLHPEKFKNQLVNQSTYMKLVGTQGWFFASLFQSNSKNIAQLAKVKIMNREDQWQDLYIPHSIRSIICLNLPSFSGGLNPWGTPRRTKGHFTPPYVDDGVIEVVGFRDAWHGLLLLAPNGHGTRLAQLSMFWDTKMQQKLVSEVGGQEGKFLSGDGNPAMFITDGNHVGFIFRAQRIRFEFHKGASDHTYMRIDGEPWKQPLPTDDDTVVVEISHLRQVKVLATRDCKARSIHRPLITGNHDTQEDDSPEEEEESVPEGEEWRKFGAADTFKIPDEVDIARFS